MRGSDGHQEPAEEQDVLVQPRNDDLQRARLVGRVADAAGADPAALWRAGPGPRHGADSRVLDLAAHLCEAGAAGRAAAACVIPKPDGLPAILDTYGDPRPW